MKKNILITIILVIASLGLVIGGFLMIQNAQKALEKDIVFLETRGYIGVEKNGFGIISLTYFNVNDYDESVFDSTVVIIDHQGQAIEELSYQISILETYDLFVKKSITIALNLNDYEAFTIEKIMLSKALDIKFEIGSVAIVKQSRESESTPQGYQVTISSFSSIPTSPSYQTYTIEVENQSNHDIWIEDFIAGNTEIVNQTLGVSETMNVSIDCSDYFSAKHVIIGGFMTYTHNNQEYSIVLDQMSYQHIMTEAEMVAYIVMSQDK